MLPLPTLSLQCPTTSIRISHRWLNMRTSPLHIRGSLGLGPTAELQHPTIGRLRRPESLRCCANLNVGLHKHFRAAQADTAEHSQVTTRSLCSNRFTYK